MNEYKPLLNDEIKEWPFRFWTKINEINYANTIIRWVIEQRLKWTDEDIKYHFSKHILINHHLNILIDNIYNDSIFEAINSVYPNRFKPWELKYNKIPKDYWTLENGKMAVKWLLEEHFKMAPSDIVKNPPQIKPRVFDENGLGQMLLICFDFSYELALKTTYPEVNIKDLR